MVERTRTTRQQETRGSRQGRFGRGGTQEPQPTRRFARSGRVRARRHREPDRSGAQKLMQRIQNLLPDGGRSSAKRRKRSGGKSVIPAVGSLRSSLGGKKGRGAQRGRKPAVFGLLGAGAAGAAAAVAKRRHSSRSAQSQAGETRGLSEPRATSTETPPPAGPDTSETAHDPDAQAGDETAQRPDAPAPEDQRD
jgi:hypothetical protein